ncbi:MAG: tetratricopeptide repeat protein, partial [Cyanobacteria bacterium P01_H01_bin.130]
EGPGGIVKTAVVGGALVEFFMGVADQAAGDAASRGAAGFPQGDGGEVSIRLGYVSAAQTRLMSTGAIAPLGGPRSLAGVLAIVGQQLDIDCDIDWGAGSDAENEPGVAFGISQGGGSQGWQQVYQFNRVLGQVPTVVVIENGETLPAEALEQWLAQLPQTVKVVVTSRERLALGRRLFLKPLELVTMERLIRLGGEQRGVPLSAQQQRRLVEIAQGIPLVAVHGLTRLALGNPLGTVLAELQDPAGGVMGFCVAPVIEALWRSPTERPMLLALERLPAGAMPHEVYDIAGLDTAAGERSWGTLIHHHLLSRRGHYWRLWPLARRYVTYLAERAIATPSGDPTLGRLGAALDERWLAWGQRWLAHYGDRDRWEWKDYGAVNEQWGNLERLMEWCVAGDRPETLWGFWVWLKGYTQFGGRAGLRKRWLSWVGAAFRARGNLGLAAAADFDLGFTYSDSDHPESLALAKTYFEQAWQLRDHCPLQLQADLIVNQCRLAVRQRETQAAQDWLAIGHQLVERLAGTSQGIDPDHERLWRRLELQLAYNQGELHMMAERWGLAQECYEQARDLAIAFQWKRAAVLSEGWIGDAIFRQGQWEEAEKILETTIRQAKEQGDRRCLALCQSTLAEIAQAQGRPRRACALAEKALVGFHDLGMTLEKEQSLQFLKELSYPPQKLEILLYGEGG